MGGLQTAFDGKLETSSLKEGWWGVKLLRFAKGAWRSPTGSRSENVGE